MKINPKKCVACGNCTYVCPMGAIYIDPELKRATINRDECVECYACYNGLSKEVLPPSTVRFVRRTLANFRIRFEPEPDVCPTTAFEPDQLEWPRVVRRAFSDPRVPHESTGVSGRGTEEVKTNDVTDRVGIGQVGFTIELGRPGIGARDRSEGKVDRAHVGRSLHGDWQGRPCGDRRNEHHQLRSPELPQHPLDALQGRCQVQSGHALVPTDSRRNRLARRP